MQKIATKMANIIKREFDVFDSFQLDEDAVILPAEDTEDTILPKDDSDFEDYDEVIIFASKAASVFGNELLPLLQSAMGKGINVTDKREAVAYLEEMGESGWADYLKNVDDNEWRGFASSHLSQYKASSVEDIMNHIFRPEFYNNILQASLDNEPMELKSGKVFRWGQHENGMYGGEIKDEYGMVESAITAHTMGEIWKWLKEQGEEPISGTLD